MQFIFESVTETQKNSLQAAAGFTGTCLSVAERLARLNLELTRAAFESSSEIAMLYWHAPASEVQASGNRVNYSKSKKS